MSQPNPQWRIVDQLELPVPMYGLKGVTLGSNFYISGGEKGYDSYSEKIFKMFCQQGQCHLEEMAFTLQEARGSHIFLPLPASLANCD